MSAVQAGEVEAVHARTTENVYAQQLLEVDGQSDILTMGLPYICPYNVNSIMNPILVACLGLGYFFNMYRGQPLVRAGGVVIMSHPTPWAFHPGHHPSYIDFFEQVLAETTDPAEIGKYEEAYATDPWYVHLYRTGNAYHGVHPFYMWYWCAHALEHVGAVIIVGGDRAAVRRLGFKPASSMADALRDGVGRGGARPFDHPPALSAAPHGRRAMTHVILARTDVDECGGTSGETGSPGAPRGIPLGRADLARDRRREPRRRRNLGADYDTEWTRRYPARLVRAVLLDNLTRPLAHIVASPEVRGDEILELVEAPAIYVANHASHVDTGLLLSVLPTRVRHKTVVAAAADHFFDRRWKAHVWSLVLAAVPIERHKVNRKSAEDTAGAAPRRLEPHHLPRRWPVPRRLVPGHAGWCGLSRHPHGQAGGARPHRRHLPDLAPGRQEAAPEPDPDHLRLPHRGGRG